MTRSLARIADIAYRRRGRMVVPWILATIVLIGLGSSFKGEYQADYNTPGSEPKADSDPTESEFRGSDDGKIATTTLPLNVPGWEVDKKQGEELIDAAEANSGGSLEIKLG